MTINIYALYALRTSARFSADVARGAHCRVARRRCYTRRARAPRFDCRRHDVADAIIILLLFDDPPPHDATPLR